MSDLSHHRWHDPILDATEERHLLRLAQAGDNRAKDKLVRHFHRQVLKIVAEFGGPDHDDLVAVGMLGLLDAIGKFDLQQDNRLSAFAQHHIRLKLREEVKSWRRQGQNDETRADRFVYHHPDAAAEEVMVAVRCTRRSAEEALKRLKGYWNGFEAYDDAYIDADPGELRHQEREKS